jgi:AcrR family transcriptional regulator
MRDYDGKTAAERIAQRREQLIAAGFEVFGTQGYRNASIRGVLEEAGLRPRYFGENFASLDELMAAVFDRIVDGELECSHDAIAGTEAGSEPAPAVMTALFDYLEADPRRARIKLREVLAAGPLSRARRNVAMERIGALLADLMPQTPTESDHDRQVYGLGVAAAGYELLIARLDGHPGMTRERVIEAQNLLYQGVVNQLTTA